MRLGIDARILAHPKCGISTYVVNLVKNFLRFSSNLEIFLFSDRTFNQEYKEVLGNKKIHKIIFAQDRRKKWAQKYLPKKLKEYRINIYHATWNNAVPLFASCPCVLTIHDLIPWVLEAHFKNKRKGIKYKLQHFLCAHWSDLIITDSYKSKEDISRLCRVKKAKIKVVYLGIEEEFKKKLDRAANQQILDKYNLRGRNYLIDPAGIDHPRRNPLFVLEGFYEFLKRKNSDFYLVYTGNFYKQNKEYKDLIRRITEVSLERKVIITGWIPIEDLKALLSQAKISIIPSLYEGFGLPILESFASEVPVIATDRGSIPEVVSDAAILVNPFDYKALADKIEKLICNEDLQKDLIEKGRRRVEFFDWRKTAQETLNLYKSLTEQ